MAASATLTPAPVLAAPGPAPAAPRFWHPEETAPDGRRRWRRPSIAPRGLDRPGRGMKRDAGEPLGAPHPIPRAWVEEEPSWLGHGVGVRIVTDPDSPDLGRAAGYVYRWDSCFRDGRNACRQPVPSPTGHERFHRGEIEVLNGDGTVEVVAGGAIPIVGGHSDRWGVDQQPAPVMAAGAMKVLDLPERQGLVGVIVEDEHGALFLGAGVPELTVAEAAMVNRSDVSNEWWPIIEPGADGAPEFVGLDSMGPVLVTRGAFEKHAEPRLRVLAALADAGYEVDEVDDEQLGHWMQGPVALDDEEGRPMPMPMKMGGRAAATVAPGPLLAAPGDDEDDGPDGGDGGESAPAAAPEPDPEPEPEPEAVDATVAGQVEALGATIAAMGARLDEIASSVASIADRLDGVETAQARVEAGLMTDADLALPAAVEKMAGEMAEVQTAMDELRGRLEQQQQQPGAAGGDVPVAEAA